MTNPKTGLASLRLAPNLYFTSISDDEIGVYGTGVQLLLRNPALCALVRSLASGGAMGEAFDETARLYGDTLSETAIEAALRLGVVINSPATGDLLALAARAGVSPQTAIARRSEFVFFVRSGHEKLARRAKKALSDYGLFLTDAIEDCDIVVVPVTTYFEDALIQENTERLRDLRRWLPIQIEPSRTLVGPLLKPGAGPCWDCIATRLRRNLQFEHFFFSHQQSQKIAEAEFGPASHDQPWDFAGREIAKGVISGFRNEISDSIVSLDIWRNQSGRHRTIRLPQCRRCGVYSDIETTIVSHRSILDDRLVDPLTGVISRLETREHESGLHISIAHFNIDPEPASVADLVKSMSHAGGGRGATGEEARIGAVGEAVERISAVFQGYEPRRLTTLGELGRRGLDPRTVMLFSESQYLTSSCQAASTERVPAFFEQDAKIDWSPVKSLTTGDEYFLPTALLYSYYQGPRADAFVTLSDGVAAGQSLGQAMLHGLLELVERDCVGIWWYNRLRRPPPDVDLQTSEAARLVEWFTQRECSVSLLDVTNDLGVPTVAAIVQWRKNDTDFMRLGACARFNFQDAAIGALRELVAGMANAERMKPPFRGGIRLSESDTSFLVSDITAPKVALADFSEINVFELAQCIEQRAGLATYFVNLTRPDIGVPVTRMIVPGLRTIYRRLAPGRLYDTPVRLGWLDASTEEELMNQNVLN